jgi:redox-sensitive bicupin YhaK (pirin superfamily)
MSGPVDLSDAPPVATVADDVTTPVLEITAGREAVVGELTVRRVLPRRLRRTVGAWCFADHMGPVVMDPDHGPDIGPHPHMGLHTVTWLVAGEILHHDSLGSEQLIRPGQLNLMTGGQGVAHAEEAAENYSGALHGVQLWVAQPEETRHGAPAFEHHAELPQLELPGGEATVLVGNLDGVTSPARADTPIVGADVVLSAGVSTLPLRRDFEHAIVVLEGTVAVDDSPVVPGQLAYLGEGRDELALVTGDRARLLLLGGVPFDEPVLMWWNFVARTREEVDAAVRAWNNEAERFGRVRSHLARIPSPIPIWSRPA